jgi:hypothetical protein
MATFHPDYEYRGPFEIPTGYKIGGDWLVMRELLLSIENPSDSMRDMAKRLYENLILTKEEYQGIKWESEGGE